MSKFSEKVVEIIKSIPQGKVVSYGQVALMAGVPRAAIQVGWILHTTADKYNLPWWRVINSVGRISTTCEEHTAQTQKAYLEKEGIPVTEKFGVDIKKFRFAPSIEQLRKFQLPEEYIYKIVTKYGL